MNKEIVFNAGELYFLLNVWWFIDFVVVLYVQD